MPTFQKRKGRYLISKEESAFLLGMEMKRRDTVFTIQHEKKSFLPNMVFDETKHAIASKFTELQGVRLFSECTSTKSRMLDPKIIKTMLLEAAF